MKIVHKLWPDTRSRPRDSRPTSRNGAVPYADRDSLLRAATSNLAAEGEPETVEQIRAKTVETACDLIDISTGQDGTDNKASGATTYGPKRLSPYLYIVWSYLRQMNGKLDCSSLLCYLLNTSVDVLWQVTSGRVTSWAFQLFEALIKKRGNKLHPPNTTS